MTLKKEKDSEKGGESVRTRMRKERERVAAFQIVLDFALRRILLHPAQVTLPCYLPTYLPTQVPKNDSANLETFTLTGQYYETCLPLLLNLKAVDSLTTFGSFCYWVSLNCCKRPIIEQIITLVIILSHIIICLVQHPSVTPYLINATSKFYNQKSFIIRV